MNTQVGSVMLPACSSNVIGAGVRPVQRAPSSQ